MDCSNNRNNANLVVLEKESVVGYVVFCFGGFDGRGRN